MHGALLVLLIGIALLMLAALRDRQTRRRAEHAAQQQVAPIPGFADAETAPTYVPATHPTLAHQPDSLTQDEQRTINAWCATATNLDLRLADQALASHMSPATAVLHDALVLVCSEGVGSVREVLPAAELALRRHQALLLATTACSADVIDTLRVNLRAGRLRSCVVLGSPDALSACGEATGATDVSRTTLQSGAALSHELGRAARVVITGEQTWVGSDGD